MAANEPPRVDAPPDIDTTPGAYPSTPSQTESPVIVSSHLSLSQAVHDRRAEYIRPQRIKVKVGTWNVASLNGTEKDIGAWFVDGKGVSEALSGISLEDKEGQSNGESGDVESIEDQERRRSKKESTVPINDTSAVPGGSEIAIYALGLQEIVDISSATEALRPYNDPHPAKKWKHAVAEALPRGYHRVAEQQLIGLYLLLYASDAIMPTISSVSTTSVGTGLMGYMGNKGAVTTRIVLGETTRIVFVNCHLTAGIEKGNLDRRNWDSSQILSRTKFEPIHNGGGVMEEFGEGIGDEDFAFWFGDLNYRLEDMPPEDVRRLLMLHTRNEYKSGSGSKQKIDSELSGPQSSASDGYGTLSNDGPENDLSSNHTNVESSVGLSTASSTTLDGPGQDPAMDPASLQATLSSLLPHDQLHNQMRTGRAFYEGWREGPIDFLPTYKYDVGSVGMFDSSEKRRGPSWCDRILFRTRRDRLEYEQKTREEEKAKRKDNELKIRGVVDDAANEAVLFDYDPETDGADYDEHESEPIADPDIVITKAGFEDRLHLDHYTSHQRILSSDHKPLDAIFTLDYDAVDPDLKAKVHQEVARDLDRAENDGRPSVTIVVDQHRQRERTFSDHSAQKFEGVDFGDVKFDHVKVRTVTIANTGRVPATLGFVDRSVDSGQLGAIAPRWLSVQFDRSPDNQNANPGALLEYTLQPGEAANVELSLLINDIALIKGLNDGEESLEDVLVLRIQNGRDYFLPLRGNWQQSVFGRSIEKLVRIPEGGVRRLQHQRPDGSQDDSDNVKWSAPRELFKLTEAIESLVERAVGEWEMTGQSLKTMVESTPGWPFVGSRSNGKELSSLKKAVREALDTDISIPSIYPPESTSLQRLEAVSQTLLLFLQSLTDGIITAELWTMLEKGTLEREKSKSPHPLSNDEERAWILDILSVSPTNSVSFTFITFTLSRTASEVAPLRSGSEAPTSPSAAFQEAFHDQIRTTDESGIRRRQVEAAYAAIFGEAMIRLPERQAGKAKKASEARRAHVVEVFLSSYTQ